MLRETFLGCITQLAEDIYRTISMSLLGSLTVDTLLAYLTEYLLRLSLLIFDKEVIIYSMLTEIKIDENKVEERD